MVGTEDGQYAVWTRADGSYKLYVEAGWSGRVEVAHPLDAGTFVPTHRDYAGVTENMADQDFGMAIYPMVSGRVTNLVSGAGVDGVTLTFGGRTTTTTNGGYYGLYVPNGWSGQAELKGRGRELISEPTGRIYDDLQADQSNHDYGISSFTWRVETWGSDASGNGTTTNPLASVKQAVEWALDGDHVRIGVGTFRLAPMTSAFDILYPELGEVSRVGICDLGKELSIYAQNDQTILQYFGSDSTCRDAQLFSLMNSNSSVANVSVHYYPNRDAQAYSDAIFMWCNGSFSNIYVENKGQVNWSYSYYNDNPANRPRVVNSVFNSNGRSRTDYSGSPYYDSCLFDVVPSRGTLSYCLTRSPVAADDVNPSIEEIPSYLRNAGNPALFNPDGTRSHIGVLGGARSWWQPRKSILGTVTNTMSGAGESGVVLVTGDGLYSATTDVAGAYALAVEHGWSGQVMPEHPFGAGEFTPEQRSYETVDEDVPDQNYGWLPPMPEVDAISPAWGLLAGGEEVEIHGRYFSNPGVFFGEVPAASVTVVSHELLRVAVPQAQAGGLVDVWVINEDGTEVTVPNGYEYRPVISGRLTQALTDIGIEGVRILVEGCEEEIWTDENGAYSVTVSAPWSGHVMAYEEGGRTFGPAELYYEGVVEDVLDANFIWTPSSVTVRGRVYNAGTLEGMAGVVVTFSPGGTVVTTNGGHFEKTLDYGWTGSFAPQTAEGQFTPAVRMLSQLALDTDSEDFSWGPTPTPGTKYVSLTGNNTFPYMSYETAAHEIQAAVNACEPGDEVVVLDGTYNLTAGGVLVSQPVTIRSLSGPEWTTVRRSSGRGGIFYLLASNAVLDGFTITGGSLSNSLPYGAKAAGVTATDGAEVRNCLIISNRADRVTGSGGLSLDNGARAINCLIIGNELIGGIGGGGVLIDRDSRLVNCTVYGNRGQSVQEWETYTEMIRERYWGRECVNLQYIPGVVYRCLRWEWKWMWRDVPVTRQRLVWVSRPGAGGVYQSTNGAVHIENSIVWGNSYGYSGSGSVSPDLFSQYGTSTAQMHVQYSCYPSASRIQTPEASLHFNPGFADTGTGDFRLREDSRCVNAGNDAYNPLPLDLAGQARKSGVIDMGPYEYQSPRPRVMGQVTHADTGAGINGAELVFSGAGTATSTGGGFYLQVVPESWSGSVTPSHTNGSFSPAVSNYAALTADVPNADYSWIPPDPVVSGRITHEMTGLGVDGAVIDFGTAGSVVSSNGGYYALTVPRHYTDTTSLEHPEGGGFTPAGRSYVDLRVNVTTQHYIWNPPVRPIAGRITHFYTGAGLAGVPVTFGSGGPAGVVSDANGVYTGLVYYGWSGRVTPAKSGGAFSPVAYRDYMEVAGAVADQDYTWVPVDPTISGRVTNTQNGTGVQGVTLTTDPGGLSVQTGSGGTYSRQVPWGWEGTLTPAYALGSFEPAALTFDAVTASRTNQNLGWIPTPRTVSGRVSHLDTGAGLNGVELAFSDGHSTTTAGDGEYSRMLYHGWSGSVSPIPVAGGWISPSNRSFTLNADLSGQDFVWHPDRTISGTIRHEDTSNGVAGVTVSCSLGASLTTDESGSFSFVVAHGWSGTVTVAYSSGSFAPASRSYTAVAADQTGQDFTWKPPRMVSGRVVHEDDPAEGVAGVTVTFAPGGSVTTDAEGYYSNTVAQGWSGTLTASFATGSFDPASRSVSAVTVDVPAQDFTWKPPRVVSGRVVHEDDSSEGIAGATVTFSPGGSVTTDAEGYYSNTVAQGWSGTLTASFATGSFDPASRSVNDVTVDVPDQDFTWKPPRVVSGRVVHEDNPAEGIAGVTISFAPGGSVTTDAGGYYSNTVAQGWSGALAPAFTNGGFAPTNRNLSNVQEHTDGQNFTWLPPRTISGQVLNEDTTEGVPGVTVAFAPGGSVTTDGAGQYAFTVEQGWTGAVAVSTASGTVEPPTRSYAEPITVDVPEQQYTWKPPRTISGRVTHFYTGQAMTNVYLSAWGGVSVLTDTNGQYSLQQNQDWTGRVTPSGGTGLYDPPWREYADLSLAHADQDFVFIPPNPTISGRVTNYFSGAGVSNVTVSFEDEGDILTGPTGTYTQEVTWGWSGVMVPTYDRGLLSPEQVAFSNLVASTSGVHMAWIPPNVVISGIVTNQDTGEGVSGVLFSAPGIGTRVSGADGTYSLTVHEGWTGRVSAAASEGTLLPAWRDYGAVLTNLPGQNLGWYPPRSISGRVVDSATGDGLDGVTVRLSSGANIQTVGGGYYLLSATQGWTGTVSAQYETGRFEPAEQAVEALTADLTNLDFAWSGSFVLSGRVIDFYTSAGIAGVPVAVSGGIGTLQTDSNGVYSVRVPYGWSGTVAPSAATGTFAAPAMREYSEVWEDHSEQNFHWVAPDPEIRGRVTHQQTGAGLDGVEVHVEGIATPAITGSEGWFTQVVAYGWSGGISPARAEGSFSPASRTYAGVTGTTSGVNFSWTPPLRMIMGSVTNVDTGLGVPGVVITFGGGSGAVTTEVNGSYSMGVWDGWSGLAVATYSSGSFVSSTRLYMNVTSNLIDRNYAWYPPRMISGQVTNAWTGEGVDGVEIRRPGSQGSAWTAGNGHYSLTVTQNWSGRLTAISPAGAFTPAYRDYSALGEDQTGQHYTYYPHPVISGRVVDQTTGEGLNGVTITFGSAGSLVTSNGGHYAFTVPYGWEGTAVPSYPSGSFAEPSSRTYEGLETDRENEDYVWIPADPILSGRVVSWLTGDGMAEVAVHFSGLDEVLTDTEGYYSRSVPFNWGGEIVPVYASGVFSPANRILGEVTENAGGLDYLWAPDVKLIRGTVTNLDTGAGVPGVRIIFSGGIGTATTDVQGAYSAEVWDGWSGTATASHANGSFAQSTRSHEAVHSDLDEQNYGWWPPRTISGRAADTNGAGVAGVTVQLPGSQGAVVTAPDGTYALSVTQGWSGRVTATNALGGLVPAYRDYAALTGDRTEQDYVWYPNPTISGRVVNQATGVGVFGVTVNFSGRGTVTSDSTGAYAMTVPYGWSGTATASHNLGSFAAPASHVYSNVIATMDGEDYFWIPADPVISGRVTNQVTGIGVAGVTITFSGLGDVTTAANGAYSRVVPLGWSGTLSASVETGEIQPVVLEIQEQYENLPGQDFTWVAPEPWISGKVVCQITGRGVPGIQLNLTGLAGEFLTDEHGDYAVQVPYNWSGSAVPESDGATYAPVQRTYSQVRSVLEQQDYTWIPDPVAGDRYVSKTGSSTYPFTSWDTAATNVRWAVDAAQAGETVWVGEGTHNLSAALDIDRPLWVRGAEGAASTELRRTGAGDYRLVRLTHSGAKMDGFTLSNGKSSGGAGARVEAGYLYNCIVRDHEGAGVYLGPMAVARMANCLVTGNSEDGIAGSGAILHGVENGDGAMKRCGL
jgi:hypothetical protein